MYAAVCKSCNKRIMLQSAKAITVLYPRIYTSKSDDIQIPPEPTTCCMSGCANCVWIAYAAELAKILKGNTDKAREIVLSKITDPNLKMFLSIELRNLQFSNHDKTEKK